jgi:hypothetical protein
MLQQLKNQHKINQYPSELRSKERDLVEKQLEHMEDVRESVAIAEKKLEEYKSQLQQRAKTTASIPQLITAALEMEVETFKKDKQYCIKHPNGVVLTPPRYQSTCGRYKGLVCVRDANKRSSIVDAYGNTIMPPQDEFVELEGHMIKCSKSIILRKFTDNNFSQLFSIYSLEEKRRLTDWIRAKRYELAGENCQDGIKLHHSDRYIKNECSGAIREYEFSVYGYDGSLIKQKATQQKHEAVFCLKSVTD